MLRGRFWPFHDVAHEKSHGHAIPIAFAATADFAHGQAVLIHGGDSAEETRMAQRHPGVVTSGRKICTAVYFCRLISAM